MASKLAEKWVQMSDRAKERWRASANSTSEPRLDATLLGDISEQEQTLFHSFLAHVRSAFPFAPDSCQTETDGKTTSRKGHAMKGMVGVTTDSTKGVEIAVYQNKKDSRRRVNVVSAGYKRDQRVLVRAARP